MSQGRFFRQTWKGLTLQTREEHVATFAYWNDKNDLPAGGLLNEEDLQFGEQETMLKMNWAGTYSVVIYVLLSKANKLWI